MLINKLSIVDHHSTFGTLVNGMRLNGTEKVALRLGDTVQIGNHLKFEYELVETIT